MIAVLVAVALAMQGGSGDPRKDYVSCLNDAVAKAKSASVGPDGFKDYASKTCALVEDALRAKLVAFDVKNGMSKKASAEDAQVQLDDYLYTAEERYKYSIDPN